MKLFNRRSILSNTLMSFLFFGVIIGSIFPFFASFFVEFKPSLRGVFSVSCVAAGLVMGIANYAILNKILLAKLKQISVVAQQISQKDLTHECVLKSEDMVGDIIISFNNMAENLRKLMTNVTSSVEVLCDHSHFMKADSASLDQGVVSQQSRTASVTYNLEEASEHNQLVSETAEQASRSAKDVEKLSTNGIELMSKARASVLSLENALQGTVSTSNKLNNDTHAISQMVNEITSIADQTNLLALNAAIEAARAGEQGRGFAVVADEVRTLATRTQGSTDEIGKTVAALQAGTDATMQALAQAREEIEVTTAEIVAANDMFTQVNERIVSLMKLNQGISREAVGQRELFQQIGLSMSDIVEIGNETVVIAHSTLTSSEKVEAIVNDIEIMVADYKI